MNLTISIVDMNGKKCNTGPLVREFSSIYSKID